LNLFKSSNKALASQLCIFFEKKCQKTAPRQCDAKHHLQGYLPAIRKFRIFVAAILNFFPFNFRATRDGISLPDSSFWIGDLCRDKSKPGLCFETNAPGFCLNFRFLSWAFWSESPREHCLKLYTLCGKNSMATYLTLSVRSVLKMMCACSRRQTLPRLQRDSNKTFGNLVLKWFTTRHSRFFLFRQLDNFTFLRLRFASQVWGFGSLEVEDLSDLTFPSGLWERLN